MRTFNHLTEAERYHIYIENKKKIPPAQIAKDMGRHRSTISRELQRNKGQRGYRYNQAHEMAQQRHAEKPKAVKMTETIKQVVTSRLEQKWSPEQIGGRLKQEGKKSVSHETIYRFILTDKKAGGELHKHLRHQAKPYRKRYGKKDYRGIIPARVDIDERPAIVDEKTRLGDWEADTVIGKGHQGVLVTLTERVSKLNLVIPIIRKEAELAKEAIIQALKPFASWVHTITFDNGREFCKHTEIATALGCKTYFAKPYHSWERGLNENHNGLLRQYFPKNQPLDYVTQEDANQAVVALNHRPRKNLNYETPWEVFCKMALLNPNNLHGVAFMS
jgi:transposase, IS30 family